MKCPNCGTKNRTGVKFCKECGTKLAIQQITPGAVRSVVPGWAWGFMGLLIGIIVTGGLMLGGVIPVDLPAFIQPAPIPTSTPFEFTSASDFEGYCPESGGVILYWNSDENCGNSAGDAGYRQRIGDGAQDVNTGQFDNQATSIKIPRGWSVRLWENPGLTGGNICFILSVRDFTPKGAFPGSNTALNDNVSSMEVFRDSSCGEDLAAGALPAPWPEDTRPGGGQAAQAAMNNGAPVCDDITPCGCLPAELQDLIGEGGQEDEAEFQNRYIEEIRVQADKIEIDLKDFDGILEQLEGAKLDIIISAHATNHGGISFDPIKADCKQNEKNPALITCSADPEEGERWKPEWVDFWLKISFNYESEQVGAYCFDALYKDPLLSLQPSESQCVSPTGVACGSICCRDKEACVVKRGNLVCQSTEELEEEIQEPKDDCGDPSGPCCLYGSCGP